MPQSPTRWFGWLLLGALALHAATYGRPNLAQMLWSCHVFTFCMALGMLFRWRSVVAAGWLFHVAIGFPAWLIESVATRGTFGAASVDWPLLATSILVHLLPLVLGALWLRPDFSISIPSLGLAILLPVAMVPLTRLLTPPELDVNLASGIWPLASGMFSQLWVFQAVIGLLCLASLVMAATVLNVFARRKRTGVTDEAQG